VAADAERDQQALFVMPTAMMNEQRRALTPYSAANPVALEYRHSQSAQEAQRMVRHIACKLPRQLICKMTDQTWPVRPVVKDSNPEIRDHKSNRPSGEPTGDSVDLRKSQLTAKHDRLRAIFSVADHQRERTV
jgi:hypothetical protein